MTAQRPESPGPPLSAEQRSSDEPARQEPPGSEATASDPGGADGTGQRPDGRETAAAAGSAPAELEDRWRRTAADLDNLRKRYQRDLTRERGAERDRVAAAFLPVLDNIDLALRHAEADPSSIVEGIRAVREQAMALLSGLGYPRQEESGVPFDPARHEVVGVVAPEDANVPPGAVAAVVRPGYGAPDRQLRPASVTVTRASGD
ncbi:nucleotide exchange factor GrpE [Pseudonocardia sp. T1-2H]|uniref:nucleotide exchange factor GrpE n=1 Tax=Pseudonocardia sp. T1-2H TaxID=3128899 RepID=UPI003100C310